MIYCASCGTSNQKGSRFCNECGEPLPSTGIRCPECNAVNPVSNVYCRACRASLLPPSRRDVGTSAPDSAETDAPEQEAEHIEKPSRASDYSSEEWLAELRQSADGQPESPESEGKGGEPPFVSASADIPDWLSDLGPVISQSPTQTDVAPSAEERVSSEPRSAPPATPPDQQSLAETTDRSPPQVGGEPGAQESDAAEEPSAVSNGSKVPGPFTEAPNESTKGEGRGRDESSRGTAKETPGDADDADSSVDTPQWLQDVLASEGVPAAQRDAAAPQAEDVEPPDTPPAMIEIPEWLEEGERGPPAAARTPPETPETPDTPAEQEQGERGLQSERADQEGSRPGRDPSSAKSEAPLDEEPAPFAGDTPSGGQEMPAWLADILGPSSKDEAGVSPFSTQPAATEESWDVDLDSVDIPDWLEKLGSGQDARDEGSTGVPEAQGPLSGLRGLVPPSPIGRSSGAVPTLKRSVLDEATLARAELLESLLGRASVEPQPQAREEETHDREKTGRWLAASALFLAVVGMLVITMMTGRRSYLARPLASAAASDLHRLVAGFDEGDHVLVAFDYGPAAGDELNAAAQAVLAHIVEQGTSISIVTTRPDGLLAAQTVMQRVSDSETRYAVIGYRPGAATAVSQLLAAIEEEITAILVVTNRPMPIRLWVEQTRARSERPLPLIAVASASLEPIVSPYLDAGAAQLQGAIYGLKGGASYENLRGTTGDALRRLDALAAGHIAVVFLVLVGAFVHALSRPKRRPR